MLPSPLRGVVPTTISGLPVVGGLVRAGMGRVFGPAPFDLTADPGDPGLFGPDSASWQIVGEPAAIAGGIRALLVQLLHPHAMAGVADHSNFKTDPLGRLHRTSAYVTATTFGSTRQALAVAGAVRRAHARVRGTAPDGRAYRADDPHLLVWVSLALTSSFLATDRAFAPRPVSAEGADKFVAEQATAAALLDPRVNLGDLAADDARAARLRAGELALPLLEEHALPLTTGQLSQWLADYASELDVNDQGKRALRFLLWPPLSAPVRAAYLPLLAGAAATLEPAQRRLLGLPPSRMAALPVAAATRGLLAAFRLSTGTSPAHHAARRRAAGYAEVTSRTASSAVPQERVTPAPPWP